eukprot:TRINITY_DN2362_c0_g1_i2.p1 TRINITY_DN2362_c0_g1~~TRINITY_DN2362_c0_g1_i2.p1  ORF type:complete len:292 (+),score=106.44 TRINITY_DN2362_c0_g1_i2:140-1015(+)
MESQLRQKFDECAKAVRVLGIFDEVEELDDISTKNIMYSTIPYYQGETSGRIYGSAEKRMHALIEGTERYWVFLKFCKDIGMIDAVDIGCVDWESKSILPFSREIAIARFKVEKERKEELKELGKKVGEAEKMDEMETQGEREDMIRARDILLIRTFAARSIDSIRSNHQEIAILRHAVANALVPGGDGERDMEARRLRLEEWEGRAKGPLEIRESIRSQVFADPNPPTVPLSQYADEKMVELREREEREMRLAKEREEREAAEDSDDEAKKKQRWDDWKDDHPPVALSRR